ncbi:MAG TPA: 50S ribosomal protein L22 [Candidatus Polarisedimenticolia bacterium]|jgi:large subunit ribosomal protein L22|nr:50S ribosomal protein L22 [Candidatus Polarisedimenticolia bacterium]
MVSKARMKYLGSSAQKTRLVVDLIRGREVGEALATLRSTRKTVARDISKVLASALANAKSLREDVDVDRLFVSRAYVDGGPSQKRIRPAPMGRAFRIIRRSCHVTIELDEKKKKSQTAGAGR